MEKAFHIVLLTWLVSDSNVQDSGILPIARTIEENFKNVPFTLYLKKFKKKKIYLGLF